MTFVDTSALLAFLDRDAAEHRRMVDRCARVFAARDAITHDYVLVETEALVRRRLGAAVARRLLEDVVPVLEVVWVDAALHRAAVAALLGARRKGPSLVDHVSFELMRRRNLRAVLALDRDFVRAGFRLVA